MKTKIETTKAPAALGPYSQALVVDQTLYASGQLGICPETGNLFEKFEDQARQVMINMGSVLKEAGYDYSDVVKTTIFVSDLSDFDALNGIYSEYFTGMQPARSCVQVARIPKDAKVEIEFIAVK